MIYCIASMTALMAFISLAVDLGRVQLVKTELQRAADAAARYGLSGLPTIATAQSRAVTAAADNTADGSSVTLNSATDIELGTWDPAASTFTVLAGTARANANAIRVTARRTSATGNAIPLLFAKVLGMSSFDVTATSVAMLVKPPGFTGTNGITMHSNTFIASYQSSVNYQPTTSSYNSNGTLGCNGAISGTGTNNQLKGSITLGASGTSSGVTITGSTTTGGTVEDLLVPAMTVVSNPGSVSAAPNLAGGTYYWPGGTYYFTSFQMQSNANIFFTGVATLNLNGNGTIASNCYILAYNYRPTALTWKIASGKMLVGGDTNTISAAIIAPGGTISFHDALGFGGSIFAKQITLNDNCQLFFDEDLKAQSTSISVTK